MKALVTLLCCFAAAAAAAEQPADFRYTLPLTTQNDGGLHRAEIPLAVYQGAARDDLGDVRVFNARGEKVPFAFAGNLRQEIQTRAPVTLPYFPLYRETAQHVALAGNIDLQIRQQADGTLIALKSFGTKQGEQKLPRKVAAYVVDASREEEPLHAFRIEWTGGAGQIVKVNVESSDDLKYWQPRIAGAPLMNLEYGGASLVQKRIEFAPCKAKYWRLSWDRATFEIQSLQAEMPESAMQPRFASIVLQGVAGEKTGEYLFDLGATPPVQRAQLLLPQSNTVAPAQIFSRKDGKTAWRAVVAATFYRLNHEGAEVVSPPSSFAPRSDRYWLVRVDQRGGGLGADTPRIEVSWLPRQVVFVARGEGPYALAYGKANATAADFPVTSLIPGYKSYAEFALPLAQGGTPQVTVGGGSASAAAWLREADWKRIALWSILIGGVAMLAWMAWRLAHQLGTSQKATPDSEQ
jgi:hypothetical protein